MIVSSASSRSEEHTSELQSPDHLVCRLLLEKKKKKKKKKKEDVIASRHRDMTANRAPRTRSPPFLPLLLLSAFFFFFFFFFFNDTATTEIYTLSLHDALPI